MKITKITIFIVSLASIALLTACSQTAQPVQQTVSQQQSNQSAKQNASVSTSNNNHSQTVQSSESPVTQPTNIDGTYNGVDEEDQIILVVNGATGTWTEVEPDGDKEVKQVTFDSVNQRMTISDDVKIYTVNDNQIIVDDLDRDPSDRIVLTK